MKTLKNKVALITGGSRGIGKECCMAFLREGAKVAFSYNASKKESAGIVKAAQGNAWCSRVDVSDYAQSRKFVEAVIQRYGRIDIVVNNAGITSDKPLFLMGPDDWNKVISVNLSGTYHISRSAITGMLKQKSGVVINMSSVSGLIGLSGQTNYSASKAGIIGFSKALAKESAPFNVRVNVVCPGYIETAMISNMKDDTRKNIMNQIPLRRLGAPAEVADLCVFLASEKARYITGEVIRIDGGLAI